MKRKRRVSLLRKVRYAGEAALAWLVYGFFALLPAPKASAFGGAALRRLGPLMGISRVARKNLDLAFPEKTDAEKQAILSAMWENLGRVIAEYPHLRRIGAQVEVAGQEHVRAAQQSGKPVIFFGAHLANWEINAVGPDQIGLPIHAVYRRPNNPWVDGLLRRVRRPAAAQIGKGAAGAREILSVLRRGGAVGMLVDQKLNEGMPVPFFGRMAMTVNAPAYFALKLGCQLVPSRVERLEGTKFRLTAYPPLQVVSSGNREADTRRILTEMNQLIEGWIRARPEQWLWIHRRWPESSK